MPICSCGATLNREEEVLIHGLGGHELVSTVDILNSSVTCEWFTPAKYVEAVRIVLGRIELDPASCLLANETVRAERIYTQETDGLAHEWIAETVFLNPPYGKDERGRSMQAVWSRKLIGEYLAGRTKEAILLLNASTSEKWFLPLWDYPICFTDHRIRFVGAPSKNAPTKGNVFIYFGNNARKFVAEFAQFGNSVGKLPIEFPAMLLPDPAPPGVGGARDND